MLMSSPVSEKTQCTFKRNWFRNRNRETFTQYVKPNWAGKPNITYLEIGVFEGASIVWMLENVLTHPSSRAVGIDPWLITTKLDQEYMDGVRFRAWDNTMRWRNETVVGTEGPDQLSRCFLQRGNSCEILRRMNSRGGYLGITKKSADICMIDGDHNAYAVLDDAMQVLSLMKTGGWVLFDDVENRVKKENHVKQGIELLQKEVGEDRLELVAKHRFMEIYEVFEVTG